MAHVICSESDVIQISTFVLSVQKWKNSEEYVSLSKRTHSVRQELWHPVQDSFMLSCLMGASWTRHITKEIFYVCRLRHSETGYNSKRQFWCVSKFMNLSSRIGGKYLHATPRKRNSSIFQLSWSHFSIRIWNVRRDFSSQETPVRQTSCRSDSNVTTAGATKPQAS